MKRSGLLTVVLVLWAGGVAAQDDASKADLKAMQGKWQLIPTLHDGTPKATDPKDPKIFWTVEGNKLIYPFGGRPSEFTLDAAREPREMDMRSVLGDGRPHINKAIYKLDGDSLLIRFAPKDGTRPDNFEVGGKGRLVRLKRPRD
jgi:uncharacterized protein (TIGR03067 family)